MRAIWSGAIGFGLVNIPVKLYSAIQESELDLDMLDKKDHSHIKYMRVNANSGKEVPWENIVKGYKVNNRYVVLTEEDFEKASPENNKLIGIKEFVNEKEIDSLYYETPYYLQPDRSGSRAYALLMEALKKTGKVALGSFILRSRESLVVVKPIKQTLVLHKIRFHQELRIPESSRKVEKPTPAELKMALSLVRQMSTEFDISRYKDTYSDKLLKLIRAKAKGKQLAPAPMKVVHSRSKDLMAQLKASLGSGTKRKAS